MKLNGLSARRTPCAPTPGRAGRGPSAHVAPAASKPTGGGWCRRDRRSRAGKFSVRAVSMKDGRGRARPSRRRHPLTACAKSKRRTLRVAGGILDRTADRRPARAEPDEFPPPPRASLSKNFSRSADTGRSVAAVMARTCASASSRVTWPSPPTVRRRRRHWRWRGLETEACPRADLRRSLARRADEFRSGVPFSLRGSVLIDFAWEIRREGSAVRAICR